MAVILPIERKTTKARVFLALVYALLVLGGITMVWPFLVMFAASFSGPYDYYRFSPVVQALWNREDRFMRSIATYFPRFPHDVYPNAPAHWGSWVAVARDVNAARTFANEQLAPMEDPIRAHLLRRRANDYAEFLRTYGGTNTTCNYDARDIPPLAERFAMQQPEPFAGATPIDRFNAATGIRYKSFYAISVLVEQRAPLHHAGWDFPLNDGKTRFYAAVKQHYIDTAREPMCRTVPFPSKPLWQAYCARHGIRPPDMFPPVADATWETFVQTAYPRRLLTIRVTPELTTAYRAHIRATVKSFKDWVSAVYGPNGKAPVGVAGFDSIPLKPYENSTFWRNFIPQVPLENLTVHSAEQAWHAWLLQKYGDIAHVNTAYGWQLPRIEAASFPIADAIAVTFVDAGWRQFFHEVFSNYRMVAEYLFFRGRAFANTILLVILSILATLTVNPLAAYALSRFNLRGTEKILLFLLATMAFPAAVTAIPGFLLIRDLGLLNTFAALILPTIASGMSVFILKGFFDGLPRELYEAATIDGAKEWQIFLKITLPMTTPILAVNALNAFISAYNSWEWAFLVCQKESHWTLAVWMYQMSQQFANQPWCVMAGFVMVSIPTAIVFIVCQKVIMRGIVLPSMK